MRKVMKAASIFTVIFSAFLSFVQGGDSPYVGQEKNEIKALSSEEVQRYLAGEGMGLAKAAELNYYPGPKHVIDLAKELRLSKEQFAKTKEVHNRMHKEAVRLGKVIIEKEKVLDSLFSDRKIDETQLRVLALDIGRLQGELRFVHLQAHLEMKRVLSPDQVNKYDELRGYQSSETRKSLRHH